MDRTGWLTLSKQYHTDLIDVVKVGLPVWLLAWCLRRELARTFAGIYANLHPIAVPEPLQAYRPNSFTA